MDFFKKYFEFVGESEAPTLYHRWAACSMLGAMLGRQVWLPFGHGTIYPNQYIMLMGSPGTRKSSAIGIARKLLEKTGYTRFAPDRVSKERFLMDMRSITDEDLDRDLHELVLDKPSELYVVAEEFTDFVGQGGMEFMTMLTKLWDNLDVYTHPKIHGKSIVVEKPTVNIIGGNTVQGLALAIPPEALGNGFMSRMIMVYAEPTGKKITFPKPVSQKVREELIDHLQYMQNNMKGELEYSEESLTLFDRMYKEFKDVEDSRFKHYSTRRFTHLLKLSMVIAVANHRMIITEEDALNANTLLHYTELRMPKSLGEFGKSKYSEVSNTIIDILNHAVKPVTMNQLWKAVAKDLSKITELGDIMKNLMHAGKVQVITMQGVQGYMPLHSETIKWDSSLLNDSFLTAEERL